MHVRISIHALLTESDHPVACHTLNDQISIHALLTESDGLWDRFHVFLYRFQSTLSSRRATWRRFPKLWANYYFNPRSPHGERRSTDCSPTQPREFQSTLSSRRATLLHSHGDGIKLDFNPRSPHGERLVHSGSDRCRNLFQSTLSSRRATAAVEAALCRLLISIHALLTESDCCR